MKHTKEPWEFGDIYSYGIGFIYGAGIEVAETNGNSLEEINANAKRIVACVNSCAGITTEALEAGVISYTLGSYADICISRQMDIYGNIDVSENLVSKDTMTYEGNKIWEEE